MEDQDRDGRTSQPDGGPPVIDDISTHRFILEMDGAVAELVYRRDSRDLVLVHTGVPREISGRGVGGRLVEAAVDLARAEGLTIVPLCPYARQWLEGHPDEASSVKIDWPHSGAGHGRPRTS